MLDARTESLARILVNYSAEIRPGDRVLIEATTAAEPLAQALYCQTLIAGGHPHLQLELPDQDALLYEFASDAQLDFVPPLRKLAYETFKSRFRVHSLVNPRGLSSVDATRLARRQKALAGLIQTQMQRGAHENFRWVTTLFPTNGYAAEAGMSLPEYEDFVYRACHADEADPVAYWNSVRAEQAKMIERIHGHHQITLRGPNVDLALSIKDRIFLNSCGKHNMPDGEIFTGPVEDSVQGWVKFTYPALYQGSAVEGIELTFDGGRVQKATAQSNESYLLEMLNADAGARYLGEFAIGTNFEISRFTGNILFDEKIGGTFHMALGNGYPETGSENKSAIHWDMICDMRTAAEIAVDGDVIYRNGRFVF